MCEVKKEIVVPEPEAAEINRLAVLHDEAKAKMTFYGGQFKVMCHTVGVELEKALETNRLWIEWSGENRTRDKAMWDYIESLYPEAVAGAWEWQRDTHKLVEMEHSHPPGFPMGILGSLKMGPEGPELG